MPSSLALGGRLGSFSSSSSSTSSCPSGRELHVPCDCEEESGGEAEGAAAGRLDSVSEHSDLTEDLWVLPPLPLLLTPLLLPLLLLSAEAPLSSLSSLSPFMSGISFSPGTSTTAAHGWRSSSVAGCTISLSCVISPPDSFDPPGRARYWAWYITAATFTEFSPRKFEESPRSLDSPDFLIFSVRHSLLSPFSEHRARPSTSGSLPRLSRRVFFPPLSPFFHTFIPRPAIERRTTVVDRSARFHVLPVHPISLRKRQLQKYCVNSIYFVYQRKSMKCVH